MKRIAILGLAVVAVFAMTAVAASAKKTAPTGPAPLTATSGLSKLSSVGLPEIECKKATSTGELNSPTQGTNTTTFTECESSGKKCGNVSPGTIKTKELVSTIGYINKAKEEVGVDFTPKTGTVLAEFECEGIGIKTEGSVIGKDTPVNKMGTTAVVNLVGAGGKQEIEKFEGGPKDTLVSEFSIAPGSKVESAQNQQANVTFTPFSTTKGKKTTTTPDEVEVNTHNNPSQPEQGRCVTAKKAKYSDAECTVAAPEKKGKKTGKYEFVAL
jgi:hypothetical protein